MHVLSSRKYHQINNRKRLGISCARQTDSQTRIWHHLILYTIPVHCIQGGPWISEATIIAANQPLQLELIDGRQSLNIQHKKELLHQIKKQTTTIQHSKMGMPQIIMIIIIIIIIKQYIQYYLYCNFSKQFSTAHHNNIFIYNLIPKLTPLI